jgi:hypothetical protein
MGQVALVEIVNNNQPSARVHRKKVGATEAKKNPAGAPFNDAPAAILGSALHLGPRFP